FVVHKLLRKPVYLLGVGYYRSATRWGRLGARFAAWGSTLILARDAQTAANFGRHTERVRLSTDLALHVREDDLHGYATEGALIDPYFDLDGADTRVVFVGVRRFRDGLERAHWSCVRRLVEEFPDHRFVLATLEPVDVDAENRTRAAALRDRHANVSV